MIKNSQFFFKNLKNIIFLGSLQNKDEIFFKTNDKLSLNTEIISSPDQAKGIIKKKIKIFKNLDKKFENYILSKYKLEETLFISIASRWIIKKKQLSKFFKGNLINNHPTRLPVDAGSGGFSWQIMRGDKIFNQLLHLVDEKLDTGPIIFNKKSIIPKHYNLPIDYYKHHFKELQKFYEEFINKLKKGKKFKLKFQNDYLYTYNPRLLTETHGWIDWSLNSLNISRFISAFDDPYAGASTYLNNKKVRIKKAQLHGGEIPSHPFSSGLIIRNDSEWIVVSTVDENHKILIQEVLDERGNNIIKSIKVGDRFFTPDKKLEAARKIRVKIGPKGIK